MDIELQSDWMVAGVYGVDKLKSSWFIVGEVKKVGPGSSFAVNDIVVFKSVYTLRFNDVEYYIFRNEDVVSKIVL